MAVGDMVVRDQARTVLREEARKNGHLGKDIGHNWNAMMA
jgi:hypothetical protein